MVEKGREGDRERERKREREREGQRQRDREGQKKAKEFCKEVASSNGELKDKEIRFMVRLKKTWGRHIFDS